MGTMDNDGDPHSPTVAHAAQATPQQDRTPHRLGVALVAYVPTLLAMLWLWYSVTRTGDPVCSGGLDSIVYVFILVCGLFVVWPLTGCLVVYSLVRALQRRQWAWVGGLTAAAIAGILGTLGSGSDVSHQAVVAVLGRSCLGYWQFVTAFATLLLVAVAGLAYTLQRLRHTPHA